MGLKELFRRTPAANNNLTPALRNNNSLSNDIFLKVHPDILPLVWIGDGRNKNYSHYSHTETYKFENYTLRVTFSGQEEPSLIYSSLPIKTSVQIQDVERPPYYPSYKGLTPEQRGVYWKLLENPYNANIDIGYVFILYYGLERHLLYGDIDKAYDVILKLRNIHVNKSFQTYSATALVLISLFKQRADLAFNFLKSLDHEYELTFPANLLMLCKYAFNEPLTAKEIMRSAKDFNFQNTNYIKKYPDLYQKSLEEQIQRRYSKDSILVNDFVSKGDFAKLKTQEAQLFANISINEKTIPQPLIIQHTKFLSNMYMLLQDAHEEVKTLVVEMRKANTLSEPVKKAPKKVIVFDAGAEKELLKQLKSANGYIDKHFVYNQLISFYYKYRDLDSSYLQTCIDFCYKDIALLDGVQKEHTKQELASYERLKSYRSRKENEEWLVRAKDPFSGQIPAFKRLCIIHEKAKEYNKAIETCNLAIQYYDKIENSSSELNPGAFSDEFQNLKQKLIQKTIK